MIKSRKGAHRLPAVVLAALFGGAALPAAAWAEQVTVVHVTPPVPSARASACITIDGVAKNALRTGTNPVRYKYSGSPYLGLRYNSCAGTLRIYYGGFTGATHYNLKPVIPNTTQLEKPPGLARVTTVNETGWGQRTYAVQACHRGGFLQSSTCTRWSPNVTLIIPQSAAAE